MGLRLRPFRAATIRPSCMNYCYALLLVIVIHVLSQRVVLFIPFPSASRLKVYLPLFCIMAVRTPAPPAGAARPSVRAGRVRMRVREGGGGVGHGAGARAAGRGPGMHDLYYIVRTPRAVNMLLPRSARADTAFPFRPNTHNHNNYD